VRFRIEQRFRGALPDVERAFFDPAFLSRLATLPKLGAPELLDQDVGDTSVRQRVRYQFTGDVSAAVRRVVDPRRLTWVEDSTHDLTTHVTTWRILPDHYGSMIRCAGTFTLVGDGPSTRRIADGDIKVNVPLVGGKVERAIVSGLEEHADAEVEVVDRWLAES
jgi:hypothetical protein